VWKDRLAIIVVVIVYLAAVVAIVHVQGFHPLGQASDAISLLFG
jgi:hypothetical protein